MATFLDIGILKKFDIIFPFLLVFILVYVVLTKTLLKGKEAFAFLIAFALSVMTLFSPIAVQTINLMAPWFVMLFIFIIFVLLAYQALGVPEDTILGVLTHPEHGSDIAYWIISIVLIIGIGSLITVISYSEGGFPGIGGGGTGFFAVLFHPKVLGIALLLLICLFTVSKLASKAKSY